MENAFVVKNDILSIAYYMNKNNWDGANKTNFQRVLYFAAVLSPVFLNEYEWSYSFSNTIFGPRNKDIGSELDELFSKQMLNLQERKIVSNRVEERYEISELGIKTVENSILKLDSEHSKMMWFQTIIKVLSTYGEKFLSRLIKEDPNIVSLNNDNQMIKIPSGNSTDNLSKELFQYLERSGKEKMLLEDSSDEEYLMLFFDLLYRKYKGGQ